MAPGGEGAAGVDEGPPGAGLCTPTALVGIGAVNPGGIPGAYDMEGPPDPPAGDPLEVGLSTPTALVGFGAVTPAGKPGA